MEIPEALTAIINTFAGVLAAAAALVAAMVKIKPAGKWLKQMAFKELYEADAKHDARLDSLEMHTLRQIICDRRLPPEARIKAGEEYLARGGNGEVEAIYNSLKRYLEGKQLDDLEAWEKREKERRA
jgi:flagellar motor switch protein FliG